MSVQEIRSVLDPLLMKLRQQLFGTGQSSGRLMSDVLPRTVVQVASNSQGDPDIGSGDDNTIAVWSNGKLTSTGATLVDDVLTVPEINTNTIETDEMTVGSLTVSSQLQSQLPERTAAIDGVVLEADGTFSKVSDFFTADGRISGEYLPESSGGTSTPHTEVAAAGSSPIGTSAGTLDPSWIPADYVQSSELPAITNVPTANALVQATAGATIADGWLSSAIARASQVPQTSTTGAANKVPYGTASGVLDTSWIPAAIARLVDVVPLNAVSETAAPYKIPIAKSDGTLDESWGTGGGSGSGTVVENGYFIMGAELTGLTNATVIPSMLNHPDSKPAIAGDLDDEFDTPTLDPSWSWVNQANATPVLDRSHFILPLLTGETGDSLRIIKKDVSTRTSWRVYAKITVLSKMLQYSQGGLVLTTNQSSRVIVFVCIGQGGTQRIEIKYYNSPTQYSSAPVQGPNLASYTMYFSIEKTAGGLLKYYISSDGLAYLPVYESSTTAWLQSIDGVGITAAPIRNPVIVSVDWFRGN